jgi:hypothetical protein
VSEWEKNLVFIDAEGVEGAEARERDRQLADPVVLSISFSTYTA